MAKANLKEQEKIQQELVEERVSKVEKFFNENQKLIWGCVGAVLAIGLLVLCYQKFYLQPKSAEAQEQMFPAEASFQAGEFELALNGDGNSLGFAQVIDEYGSKAGASAYLYAGVCELQLGNYENALNYLKKYNGKDAILAARALACQGDAYVGLEKYKDALSCFEKAAAKSDNIFSAAYLLKAGVVCEELGDNQKALSLYKQIKDKYPQSREGYDIDKYISRIENAR
ncbi:MAG: tetratricopeptide repeat protein [Bacteroidales bacterium]|nr:tetratricopeptide repeat protein [Bacteroidales bacterium]MCR5244156.1 tetratricopeptide repeat protein [Bacteroidales bacterium]MDT3356985.1 tetratricopeptide repeat protein [Bacteroidota bacterium]